MHAGRTTDLMTATPTTGLVSLWSAKVDKIDDTGRLAMSVVDGRCQWLMGDVNGRWAMSVVNVKLPCVLKENSY